VTDLQSEFHLIAEIEKKRKKSETKLTQEDIKKNRKKLKTLLSDIQTYAEYKRAKSKYSKDTEALRSKLDALRLDLQKVGHHGTSELLEGKLDKLYTKQSAAEAKSIRLNALRDRYTALEETLPERKPKLSVEQLSTRIGELEQIIELHGAVGEISKNCPLCGTAIERSLFKRIARDAETELPKRKKELAAAKGFVKLKEIKEEGLSLKGCEEELEDLESKIQVLESKKQLVERSERLQTSIADISGTLKQIRKPVLSIDIPDTDHTEDELERQIQDLGSLFIRLKELEELESEYSNAYPEARPASRVEKEISRVKREQSKLVEEINEINEVLPNLLSHQKQLIDAQNSKEDFTTKIDKIKAQLDDLPILEALIKAYGSKGLKVEVMRKIATLVESNLNKYSSLIFAEHFTFSIKIAENSFSVLVDRGGGEGSISDISKLSGAEGASFTLLLLLSMLPLIPRRLRADTIVLDECDAYLGPPLKELFFTKFLPILNSVVPKVIVITTDTKVQVEGARNIIVEKEGQESILREVVEFGGLL
jgi:DNA repair exonuclease SbcCD ATPase subunit